MQVALCNGLFHNLTDKATLADYVHDVESKIFLSFKENKAYIA